MMVKAVNYIFFYYILFYLIHSFIYLFVCLFFLKKKKQKKTTTITHTNLCFWQEDNVCVIFFFGVNHKHLCVIGTMFLNNSDMYIIPTQHDNIIVAQYGWLRAISEWHLYFDKYTEQEFWNFCICVHV